MSRIERLRTVAYLLYLCVSIRADDDVLRKSTSFQNQEIILDHQPLKDNNVVYGGCDVSLDRRDMNCTLYLESFPTQRDYQFRHCSTNYRIEEAQRHIGKDFQLKLMFNDRVVFAWLDIQEDDKDLYQRQQLLFRTVRMSDCEHVETKISIPLKRHLASIDDFFFVPYDDTYDLFYVDAKACGDKVCGRTYDKDGKLINGPVPSYIPAKFLKTKVAAFVPVKTKSSALGHFLLSKKFRFISSRYGKVKELMELPIDIEGQVFSSENGYLSFCHVSRYYSTHVNCSHFDVNGDSSTTLIEFDHMVGHWLSVYSLSDKSRRFLLLVSECTVHSWCIENIDEVLFHVYLVNRDGGHKELSRFRGVKCVNRHVFVQTLKMLVRRERDGSVRVNLVCLEAEADTGKMDAFLNLESRTITDVTI